jgi:hypothetical protein
MRGVTRLAGHPNELVLGAIVVLGGGTGIVTAEAAIGIHTRRGIEGKNGAASRLEIRIVARRLHRIDVSLAGTMTSFTASGRLMRSLLDSGGVDNVTISACLALDNRGWPSYRSWKRTQNDKHRNQQNGPFQKIHARKYARKKTRHTQRFSGFDTGCDSLMTPVTGRQRTSGQALSIMTICLSLSTIREGSPCNFMKGQDGREIAHEERDERESLFEEY